MFDFFERASLPQPPAHDAELMQALLGDDLDILVEDINDVLHAYTLSDNET